MAWVAAALVIAFATLAEDRLVIALVSPDLARTAGIDVARLNLFFLLAFALAVSLGLRFLGVLLMGSLIIIPAATAKHLARSLPQMRVIAVALAMSCTLIGSAAASWLGLERGPLTIAVAAAFFFVSLGMRRTVRTVSREVRELERENEGRRLGCSEAPARVVEAPSTPGVDGQVIPDLTDARRMADGAQHRGPFSARCAPVPPE